MTSCPYAHDDGAYVLGALSPGERAGVRAAPGRLRGLPRGGRRDRRAARPARPPSDPTSVATCSPTPGAAGGRMPALLDGRPRQPALASGAVRRRRYAGAGLAAAVAGPAGRGRRRGRLAPATTDPPLRRRRPARRRRRPRPGWSPMHPVAEQVPVDAEIGLTERPVGHRGDHALHLPTSGHSRQAYTFRLMAHGADGATEQVGSWLAGAGRRVDVTGSTRFTGTGPRAAGAHPLRRGRAARVRRALSVAAADRDRHPAGGLAVRSPSTVKTISASQTSAKPASRAGGIGSWKISTPTAELQDRRHVLQDAERRQRHPVGRARRRTATARR